MLLAACSPGGEGGGQASGSPSASESSPAGEAGAQVTGDPAGSGGGAPAGTWDPLSWEPSVRVTRQSFSDAEREAFYTETLARNAEQLGLTDPPEVERVAWAQGPAEYGEAQARCMDEAGFTTVSDGVGNWSFSPGVPESQGAALNLASYQCEARYPMDPEYAQDWTEEQVGLVYDYWDEYYLPCMEAHGHPIDDSGQPSREAYVAAFHTPDRSDWWPNEYPSVLPVDEQRVLAQTCPPMPPDSAMYGQ